MRLLVLGGTRFVGRAYVEEALAAGHEVTLFNRGQTAPRLFPDVETLIGDREVSLDALAGRTWEAVFDPSCYLPRVARMSAETLFGSVGHYTFVSSLSAYQDVTIMGQDETASVATIEDPTTEEITDTSYGPLKVLAERAVQEVFGPQALILRPGYIGGPYDSLDRMPYWLRRVARGGEILAPGSPGSPVQLIDARDLAGFALMMAARDEGGVFNLCAPQEPYRFGDLLETAAAVTGGDATFTWASEDFLVEHGLDGWEALPWWNPPAEAGFARFDPARALAAGLDPRPIEQTLRDCWSWDRTRAETPLREDRGLPPEREAELLASWHERAG